MAVTLDFRRNNVRVVSPGLWALTETRDQTGLQKRKLRQPVVVSTLILCVQCFSKMDKVMVESAWFICLAARAGGELERKFLV